MLDCLREEGTFIPALLTEPSAETWHRAEALLWPELNLSLWRVGNPDPEHSGELC